MEFSCGIQVRSCILSQNNSLSLFSTTMKKLLLGTRHGVCKLGGAPKLDHAPCCIHIWLSVHSTQEVFSSLLWDAINSLHTSVIVDSSQTRCCKIRSSLTSHIFHVVHFIRASNAASEQKLHFQTVFCNVGQAQESPLSGKGGGGASMCPGKARHGSKQPMLIH